MTEAPQQIQGGLIKDGALNQYRILRREKKIFVYYAAVGLTVLTYRIMRRICAISNRTFFKGSAVPGL